MNYLLNISSMLTALTLILHLPCLAMEGNDEPTSQPRKLALYKDTKDSPNVYEQKPLDKKINRYMYRFAIKCGEETEKENFKKTNKRPNDGFTRLTFLDVLVSDLLNNQFKYVVDSSADFKEYILVLENIDTTDLRILMPLVRPLMHSNPFYVQYVPRDSFGTAIKAIFDEIEDEVYEKRANTRSGLRKLGLVEEQKLDRSEGLDSNSNDKTYKRDQESTAENIREHSND